MSSYKVIFSAVIMLLCVALFAGYAQIAYEGAGYDKVPNPPTAEVDRGFILEKWEGLCEWFWGGSIGQIVNPDDGGGLGFIIELATFSVPGLPLVFSWIFWIITAALVIAITRVSIGMISGGGG